MDEVGEDFAARLGAEVTSLALCWRLVRMDGLAFGFTSHDGALAIDGLRFESAPGIAPSAVELTDGLAVDTLDVAGALSSGSITADDLLAGRYDGALAELFMVDWRAPEAGRHVLARGRLGTVEAGAGADAGFVATLVGPISVMQDTAIESYSPECRAELGDRRCKVDLRGRMRIVEVAQSDNGRVLLAGASTPVGVFLEGILRVLDGPFAGLERRVVANDGEALVLDTPLRLSAGTRVRVTEGCDKRFATCHGRFGNDANFRGEPHVPGGDLLTRIAGL